jgi:leader peptidase (prepilin peptidase) / N-methyltransferase
MTMLVPALLAFLFGAVIGSFLNVCISRWPDNLSVVAPRSRCPKCAKQIAWYDNIPVLSWLVLRGRCRGCGEPISLLYPGIELVVGLGWAAAFVAFGPTFTALRLAIFGTLLLGIAVTDAQRYLIPDGFTVFGLAWGLLSAMIAVFIGEGDLFAGPTDALIGACAGAGAIAIVGWLGEVALKKEAMGFGDVTLMAMVGAALGPNYALLTVFIGAALGAVTFVLIVYPIGWLRARRAKSEFEPPLVPFGVFLAPAALLTLLWGSDLWRWYNDVILAV